DIKPVADAPTVDAQVGEVTRVGGGNTAQTIFAFAGITLTLSEDDLEASGLSGQLLAPPFSSNTGGNINNNSSATDIIAIVGDFDSVVEGHGGNEWQNLYGVSGNNDFIFFDKDYSRYQISNLNINVNNGIPNISASIKDLDSG